MTANAPPAVVTGVNKLEASTCLRYEIQHLMTRPSSTGQGITGRLVPSSLLPMSSRVLCEV